MHNPTIRYPKRRPRKSVVRFTGGGVWSLLSLVLLASVEKSKAFQLQGPSKVQARVRSSTSALYVSRSTLEAKEKKTKDLLQSEWFDDSIGDDSRFTSPDMEMLLGIEDRIKWVPAMMPIIAYFLYDPTAQAFAFLIDAIAQNNFVPVDGGQYQAKIIAPAINGVVLPAVSILFANLIGTTITTLRQRQLDIRTSLNLEAGQLRILQSLLEVLNNKEEKQVCFAYLAQYTSRVIAESQPMPSDALTGSLDTELNGILRSLNRLVVMSQDATNKQVTPNPLVLDKAYQSCTKLYDERAKRVAALRSTFPTLHFGIVAALAFSICIAFLLESNQDILMFLNAIQLRILWTMLVGTFSALAIVCYDLGNPFRGSYQISTSVDQLYTIRLALRANLSELRSEEAEGSKTVTASNGSSS
ncbi:unnamed protein product [Cylindrotheca closterium]|uniref:Transmembrane protein n=1 Tax=Cylindrotheca closterium TaxID=2856 RepID=A0AAD2CUN6_9STRA|nr:unnamed protein product [Cylindrotheca closterium]